MSNKILVKAEPTLYQQPGDSPTIRDLGRTFFTGRGTRALKPNEQSSPLGLPAGEKVGVGRRLAAGLGLAGKVGAAAATAQQTAERMQGGDFTAPLQAGYTYQANDPTGTLTAGAINAEPTAHNRVGVTSMPLPAPGEAANELSTATVPAPQAPTSPLLTPHEPNLPVLVPQGQGQGQGQGTQLDQQAIGHNVQANTQQPYQIQQPPQQGQGPIPYQPFNQPAMSQFIGNNTMTRAFADTVFDKLGPDMVYKMTPHQIATLSAYMYLKLS